MSNINILYTDITPDLSGDWNKDVAVARGTRAVKNSILGIITTKKGSRPFDPLFGCDVYDSLFENMTMLTEHMLETSIVSAIRTYEPRVYNLDVKAQALYDSNAMIVTVNFSIVDNPDEIEQIKLKLSRG